MDRLLFLPKKYNKLSKIEKLKHSIATAIAYLVGTTIVKLSQFVTKPTRLQNRT
ncbi:hypothetical protein [Okeania sp. KiyG1]|uniref:hypothetical protein n=1 Tax=Okeania sp. KiyG1 TaxID=2720165 RepID=UPI0019228EF9|nr:hypothetical protein [Okeania sp. KiyG1]